MKKLHKILTLCLALAMLLGIMPTPASASDDRTYLVWTNEEYWDLSIPRPGENTFMFVLVKPGADEKWKNCDNFEPYNGNMYEVLRVDECDASILSRAVGMKAAALDTYNRIDDPEYKAILVDMFGLYVKADGTAALSEEIKKPEAPAVPPESVTTTEETTSKVTSFSDVKPGDWYYEAVTEFAKTGLLAGYEDGTFRPNNPVTGGEICTILCRIYGIGPEKLDEWKKVLKEHPDSAWLRHAGQKQHDDRDIVSADHWAMPAITAIFDTCLIFNPCWADYELNRGNVLDILVSMAAGAEEWLEGTRPSYDDSDEAIRATIAGIPDVTYNELNVPERTYGYGGDDPLYRDCWKSRSVALAYQMGIAHGVDDKGTCDPWSKVTRAQLVQMLYNLGITRYGQLVPHSNIAVIEEVNKNQQASGVIIGGISGGASSGK